MTLYEIVLEESFYNQQCINRFNYLGSGTPASVTGSFALASAFGAVEVLGAYPGTSVISYIRTLQSSGVILVQLTVRAIYEDANFYATPFVANTNGGELIGGNAMSPLSAWGFRSSRVVQSIGRGYKRFVGITEGMVDAGGVISSASQTLAQAAAVKFGETLTYDDEGNTLTFVPCIVQKLKYTTPSGKFAYKYYPSEAAQAPHVASGIVWEPYNTMRSQGSRQYGRGS